ncbi:hypothetical protein O0I10_008755 [Lichtheimia ornata]|uniref:Alcohol acetyltransferase n=1 Tax=Lichtheimia ornata TaxID=688661 RepID=A0AAD7UYV3_9FUNG|nr:uncharacterized protein O0I10_008755 [Lichtheimia ornata]KAJ8655469.1 hypothetical protein O0I10_008755 [Lichtheimia ornata]
MDQRPLGLFERFQAGVKLINCYGVVSFTAVLRHATPRPQTTTTTLNAKQFYLPRLHAAVQKIVDKHPLLSTALVDYEKPTIRYTCIPDFDLASIVSFDEMAFWESDAQANRIAEQCDKDFDFDNTRLPLWRLHIDTHPERPDECSITVAGEHTMADGMSLMIFMQELVQLLDTVKPTMTEDGDEVYMIKSNKAPINPPCEERNGPRLTPDEVNKLKDEQQQQHDKPPANAHCWQGDRRVGKDQDSAVHRTTMRTIKVDDPLWGKVCKAAKEHGLSPHAAIMAATLLSFADIYPDEEAVETYTPMNVRASFDPPVPNDEMGNFIGSYPRIWSLSQDINQHTFWDLAALYQREIKAHKPEAAKEVHSFALFGDYPQGFTEIWTKNWDRYRLGRTGGIELSDLGRCNWGDSVQELYFGQSAQAYSIGMGISTVSTTHGMRATLSFQKDTLDEDKLEAFAPTILSKLESCI